MQLLAVSGPQRQLGATAHFSRMNSTTFEQFCWWLLKKDNTLIGCKRLGRSGTAQHGIDIFAYAQEQPEKLSFFECKAWKEFGASNLTEAVDAFLDGNWARMAHKFTLILAQQDIGHALADRWTAETTRMKQAGIEAELWSAHTLTMKVQFYPDILTKFFPWESIEHRANLWMQRVGFYELVSKAFFDPRERVQEWARELATHVTTNAEIDRHDPPPLCALADQHMLSQRTSELKSPALLLWTATCERFRRGKLLELQGPLVFTKCNTA